MDSKRPRIISESGRVQISSFDANPPTHGDDQQYPDRQEFDPNLSHVTETQPEHTEHIEDPFPDGLENYQYVRPKPQAHFEPVKLLSRPPSTGKDLHSGFAFHKPTKDARNVTSNPLQKQMHSKGPSSNLARHAIPPYEATPPSAQLPVSSNSQQIRSPGSNMQGKKKPTSGSTHERLTSPVTVLRATSASVECNDPHSKAINQRVKEASSSRDILTVFPECNALPPPENLEHPSATGRVSDADNSRQANEPDRISPQQHTRVPAQAPHKISRVVNRASPAVANRKKVSKPKQKSRTKGQHPNGKVVSESNLGSTLPLEEIINLMAYRLWKDRRNQAAHETSLQAKELEIEELTQKQEDLQARLIDSERTAAIEKQERARYKEAISKKVGKITNFVNGLAKDHNQLRDDAKQIRDRQHDLQTDKEELAACLESAGTLAKEWSVKLSEHPKLPLHDAQQEIHRLEGLVDIFERQMEESASLLAAERDRTARLEAEVRLAANNHNEVKDLIRHNRVAIFAKLDDLSDLFEIARSSSDSAAEQNLLAKVEECVDILNSIEDNTMVLPEKLQEAIAPVEASCEGILASVELAKGGQESSNKDLSQLEASIKRDLDALREGFQAERNFLEQMTIMRQSQAALTEELRSKDSALSDALERSVASENHRQSLLSQISSLESEVASSRGGGAELSKAVTALREAEGTNSEMTGNLAKAQIELADLQGKLQEQTESVVGLQDVKDKLEGSVTELQSSLAALEKQRLESEQETVMRCNNIRIELSECAKKAKADVTFDYENKLHRLSQQKKDVDAKLEQLRSAQGNQSQTLSRFRAQIAELEIKVGEKEKTSTDLQEQLRLASEKLSSKDVEIQAFKTDSAANSELLGQLSNEAKGLRKRVADLAELRAQSQRELGSLHIKNEEAEKVQERIAALCRRVGIDETAETSILERVALLEETVLLHNNKPPLPGTISNAATELNDLTKVEPASQVLPPGTGSPTHMISLPDIEVNHTKRLRRRITRHASTEIKNFRAGQAHDSQEDKVLLKATRQEEKTVQTSNSTHKVSSRGSAILSDSQRSPSEVDLIPASVVPETQLVNAIVPFWQTEAANERGPPTSPLPDLSHLFAKSPMGFGEKATSPTQTGQLKQHLNVAKSNREQAPSRKRVRTYSSNRVQAGPGSQRQKGPAKSVVPRMVASVHTPGHEPGTKGPPSQAPLLSPRKVFDIGPDFSSPSTDHLKRQMSHARKHTPSINRLRETSNIGVLKREPAQGPASIGQTAARKPLMANHRVSSNNTKLPAQSGATRGILKNPVPQVSPMPKKRMLDTTGVQTDGSNRRVKRRQTSEADRYELRFRQELA